MVTSEIAAYISQLKSLLDRLCGIAEGLDEAQLNRRPAEFRASGRDAVALVAKLRRLSYEIETALAALPPSDLEQRLVPPASLWGEGEPHEISRREAVVHVIEHAALHLGHLQMTRDWALQAPR
jgi:hypothetical protein